MYRTYPIRPSNPPGGEMKLGIKAVVLSAVVVSIGLLTVGCAGDQAATTASPSTVTVTQKVATTVTASPVTVTTTPAPVTTTATTIVNPTTSSNEPSVEGSASVVSQSVDPIEGPIAHVTTNSGYEQDGRVQFSCAGVLEVIRPNIGCLPLYQLTWNRILSQNPTGFSDFNGSPDLGWFRGSVASVDDRLYVGLYACLDFYDAYDRLGEAYAYSSGLASFEEEIYERYPEADDGDSALVFATATQVLCGTP